MPIDLENLRIEPFVVLDDGYVFETSNVGRWGPDYDVLSLRLIGPTDAAYADIVSEYERRAEKAKDGL